MKKLLTLLFTLLPLCGWAEKESYAIFDEASGTLTFMYGERPEGENVYNTILCGWDKSLLKKAVFDPSFAETRPRSTASWFYNANSMTEITGIQYLNTSEVTNMSNMFYNCCSLTSLDISHFDTSNVTDMNQMFYDCGNLSSLDLSNFNTSQVSNMSYLFAYCHNINSLDVSHFDTSNVTDMNRMFTGCEALTNLDVSNFNTSKVSDMSYMFSDCVNLGSLDVSHFNTSNVTDMNNMFSYCTNLESLDISGFDFNKVTDTSYMFAECCLLANLNITSFDFDNISNTECMFERCLAFGGYALLDSGTGTLTFKYGFKPSSEYFDTDDTGGDVPGWYQFQVKKVIFDSSYAKARPRNTAQWFYCQESLTEITGMQYFNTSEVTNMFRMFSGCSLTEFDLSHFNTSIVWNMSRMFEGCNFTSLDLSHFDTGCVKWMNQMFSSCPNLSSLDLSHFDTSNVADMGWMFMGCENLTSLDMSHFDTSNVTNMSGMFSDCKSLTSLDLSHFNTSNVTNMSGMFSGCESLTSLDLSHFDTSNVEGYTMYMFSDCKSLINLNLSGFNTSKIMDMYCMFYGCSSLESLDLSSFDTSNVTNMRNMFMNCSNLKSTNVSSFDTSSVTDFTGMFKRCSSLESLDVSSFNICSAVSIEEMFAECCSMKSIDLSSFNTENITSLFTLFYGCSSLTTLDLTSFDTHNVEKAASMFEGCNSLKTIYVSKKWDFTSQAAKWLVELNDNFGQEFLGCYNLVGCAGTVYDYHYDHADIPYARVDEGPYNPGYLTAAYSEEGVTYTSRDGTASIVNVSARNEEVDIPSDMTIDGQNVEVTTIGEDAFKDNNKLKIVSIPESIEEIGASAFAGCSDLKSIYCYAKEPIALVSDYALVRTRVDGNDISASSVFDKVDKKDCALYVPIASISKYKNAAGWREFSRIEPIPSDVMGDANGDRTVDQQDVKAVGAYIMTNEQSKGFVWRNADANGDKKINVADIVKIINSSK